MSSDPNLESAINLVENEMFTRYGDRSDVSNYLVIVTRSVGGLDTVHAINDLKSKGTKVIGVGE